MLEAIATGKAVMRALGMALRWLKPLEQGFDVNITAGVHGGCMRLIGSTAQGITKLEEPGSARQSPPPTWPPQARTLPRSCWPRTASIPNEDVTWTQFPGDVLPLTFEKGEAAAFVDGDPETWLWLKQYPTR